jgi:glycerol-3-phosphate dehydrogenase (NAD(P)+)
MAVPTQYVRSAYAENLHLLASGGMVVNCTKGIEEKTYLLPHQVIEEVKKPDHYLSMIGPSFAKEIINREPTIVSLGYDDLESSITVRKLVETPYFTAIETGGYKTLELAGALKNVYAILCGYAAGMGFGKNTNVKIILSVKSELRRLSEGLGYSIDSIDAPGVLGDLILSCSSDKSRNYTFGYELANGNSSMLDTTTVEGYHTCRSISEIASRHDIFLPLASLATRISGGERIPRDRLVDILSNTA